MTVLAFCLPRPARRNRFATQKIFAPGDGLQMIGIDAAPDAAFMIWFKTSRNWPIRQFIRKPMRANNAGSVPKLTIAPSFVDVRIPYPASTIRLELDFGKEPFRQFFHGHQHATRKGRSGSPSRRNARRMAGCMLRNRQRHAIQGILGPPFDILFFQAVTHRGNEALIAGMRGTAAARDLRRRHPWINHSERQAGIISSAHALDPARYVLGAFFCLPARGDDGDRDRIGG